MNPTTTTTPEPLQRVLDRLERVKQQGDQFKALCPAHDDHNPSLSVSVGDDGRVLLHCFAGCELDEILDTIGLTKADLFTQNNQRGFTLEEYSQAKRLPLDFLQDDLGLTDGKFFDNPCVRMPYFDTEAQAKTVRLRLSLNGGKNFHSPKGSKLIPYGLQFLNRAQENNFVLVVEGESDTQTALYHKVPVIGIPGAESWRDEWERYFDGIGSIYMVREPDKGGDTLWEKMSKSPLIDRLYQVTLPEKDISALHLADPERFKDRLKQAIREAIPAREIGADKGSQGLRGRVRLGERMVDGVEPPALLTERLYAGKIHAVNSEPGEGKTLYALYEVLEVIGQGLPVLYLDAENGPNLITERLEDLGADPSQLDELLYYHPFPDITLEKDSLENLKTAVDEIQPALAVFDSLPDFLALAGLNENDAGDVTRWMVKVVGLLRERGVAVIILDHLTKSAEGRGRYARGSGAKLAKVDVSYQLTQTIPFDRERVGEVTLVLRKDREAYLPIRQKFAVGGTGQGLMFRPADGIVEDTGADGLTDNDRLALEALETHYRYEGATFSKWMTTTGMAKTSFRRAIKNLTEKAFVEKRGQRYYPKPPVEGPRGFGPKNGPKIGAMAPRDANRGHSQNTCKTEGPQGPWPPNGPDGPRQEGPQGPPPYKGGPDGPSPAPGYWDETEPATDDDEYEEFIL